MADVAADRPIYDGRPLRPRRPTISVSRLCTCGHIFGAHLHPVDFAYEDPTGCRGDRGSCSCTVFDPHLRVPDLG